MWFEELTGFKEISSKNVHDNIKIDGQKMISKVNNKSYQFGTLEVVSLEHLRKQQLKNNNSGNIKVSEVIANIQDLHCDPKNENALFQAASQFNLLEMVSPKISPKEGIDIYENDFTQGPACAIACGAGTIYRNYFALVNNQIGQTDTHQIDCLNSIGEELNNQELQLWKMVNGYALVNQEGILAINKQIGGYTNYQREFLKDKLKVGIQWNTEVTLNDKKQIVSQIYCSALPVAYSNIESFYWENFARIILEATYEATLYSAMINLKKNKSNSVFLTLVGGGAFGNDLDWILDSLFKALDKFKDILLDVKIVSYGRSNDLLKQEIEKFNRKQPQEKF
ncbi:hypothetical protein H0I23_06175 [Cellulophaga sp. HaHaR_3_176]|uniref:hypothetical protein n=1 Tax=Cellulophaga sp. HaHaR_3_176 TaxID=1942464 RepID=UPI001C1FBBD9|nr:hypothetical protein [Cellulophaga sp. HaHaR_3_176]QWX85221.1 hypothetical protein H0I23_06175 [Cellulophaga sp. HaHaR_3_176]